MKTGHFTGFDQTQHFYREWNYNENQKTIIIIHRGHEHSGRLEDFAKSPKFSNYNLFAFDLRGHGETKVATSSVFMDYVRDLEAFAKHLNAEYAVKNSNIFVLANSIGGVIASAWVHDFAPEIAGIALLAPAFKINLIVPGALSAISLGTKLNKNLQIKSYVKSSMLTHDLEQQKLYDTDPLITRSIDAKLLVDLAEAGSRLVEDAAAIDTPTLILSAEKDKVVFNKDQIEFFNKLDTALKEHEILKDFFHGILFETGKEIVYTKIAAFADKCFSFQKKSLGLSPDPFTLDEYKELQQNIGNNFNFKFQKWSLGKIGKISEGMAIGLEHGFDSGISLDYVYKNAPKGKLGFGKMMDKNYLEAIGWRGIRIRKVHLLQLLEERIKAMQIAGRPIKILDIAGGTGNYLFDVKDKYPEVEILVNDFMKANVEAGEKVIVDKNYTGIRFTNYDCFDPETYKKLDFQPNIVIVSGIFELFGENDLVSKALVGINSIAEPQSTLLYTGQPWHPQLKMIAYVLNSHQKKGWVMRRRSQKELDRVFKLQNINKEKMLIDDFGIFTVSSAALNN